MLNNNINSWHRKENKKISLNFELIVFLSLVLCVNIRFFLSPVFDSRDTTTYFKIFYSFYNELFVNSTWLQWMPFSMFGQSSFFVQINFLSFVDYFFIYLGKLLAIENVYKLFLLSTIYKQIIYVWGGYLLSKRIFKKRITTWFVCIVLLGSLVWYWHIYFMLINIFILPLILYHLVIFLQTNNPKYFWLAGIISILGAYGALYLPILWLFTLSVFVITFHLYSKKNILDYFKEGFFQLNNLILFLIFISLLVFFLYSEYQALQNTIIVSSQRISENGFTNLATFIHYGGNADIYKIIFGLIIGNETEGLEYFWDNNLYLGILPFFFFILAIVKERSPYFNAFFITAFSLFILSFGGIFSILISYFPGIRLYRWVAWDYALIKILIIFCAGYGFENFLISKINIKSLIWIGIGIVTLIDITLSGMNINILEPTPPVRLTLFKILLYFVFVSLFLIIFYLRKNGNISKSSPIFKIKLRSIFPIIAIILISGDFFLFQYHVNQKYPTPQLDDNQFTKLVAIRNINYQPERMWNDNQSYPLLSKTTYPYEYQFASFDPCYPTHPEYIQFLNQNLNNLLVVTNRHQLHTSYLSTPSDEFLAFSRCEKAKLYFSSNPTYTNTQSQTQKVIHENIHNPNFVVIEAPEKEIISYTDENLDTNNPMNNIEILSFTSNSLKLLVNVSSTNGAWLIYADSIDEGWKAYIDGQNTQIFPANIAFKAIKIPKGSHEVEYIYRSNRLNVIQNITIVLSISHAICFLIGIFRHLFLRNVQNNL